MGFNTTVVVLNDALHLIAEDPNFGKNLSAAALKLSVLDPGTRVDVPSRNHANAATVIEYHHADFQHVILVGGNYGRDLGCIGGYALDPSNESGAKALLKRLAENLGFEVAIRKCKKRSIYAPK